MLMNRFDFKAFLYKRRTCNNYHSDNIENVKERSSAVHFIGKSSGTLWSMPKIYVIKLTCFSIKMESVW